MIQMSCVRPSKVDHHKKNSQGDKTTAAQTDEEKQKDRQRNEREIKQQEIDAINKREQREAREIRQLEHEIISQRKQLQDRERHAQFETTRKYKGENHATSKSHNLKQQQTISIECDQESGEQSTNEQSNNSNQQLQSHSNTDSDEQSKVINLASYRQNTVPNYSRDDSSEMEDDYHGGKSANQQQSSSSEQQSQQPQQPITSNNYSNRRDTSPQKSTHATPSIGGVLSAFIPASTNPLAILSSAFRDDSTESDQSLTFSQSQADAYHRLMCRAPIASLDCMEEFSGTGGHLDFGRSISLGSNPALPIRHTTTITPGLRYKNLGKSGLRISNVGLGTWPLFTPGISEETAENVLKVALDSGINLFDLAEPNSETIFGKVLHKFQWRRSTFVIITKIYWSIKSEERGLSRKHIIESVKASLQRLGVEYIDLVIIHKADSMCPMEEIVRAMNYVISKGWVMYWGTARWSPVEIMEAYTNCRQFNCITPIVEQAEYHMFCREKAELYLPEMYNKIGVGLMAWGPLSMALSDIQNCDRGIFFSKGSFIKKSHSYSWTEDETNLKDQTFGMTKDQRMEEGRRQVDKIRDLANLAEKLGCSPTQLSIAWSLKHEPVQCLLIGATTLEQLHQNLQALQLLPRLSTSVMLELERILDNKPVRPPLISTLALR